MDRPIPVRVSLPVSVASDIGRFQKAVGSVLDRLGCPACCSGHDIEFALQRTILLEADLQPAHELAAAKAPFSFAANKGVALSIAPDTAKDIDGVNRAIAKAAEALGCPACCSGHDLRIALERSFVMNDSLNLREQVIEIGL